MTELRLAFRTPRITSPSLCGGPADGWSHNSFLTLWMALIPRTSPLVFRLRPVSTRWMFHLLWTRESQSASSKVLLPRLLSKAAVNSSTRCTWCSCQNSLMYLQCIFSQVKGTNQQFPLIQRVSPTLQTQNRLGLWKGEINWQPVLYLRDLDFSEVKK